MSIPLISATGAGTCHATLVLANGTSYSTNITFAAQWYACGSDPHGSGEDFESDTGTWTIDNACADAGATDAQPDVSDGARE